MQGMNGDESDVGLMAGVSVPIWRGRYRAERREAGALLQSATYDQADLRNRLRAELSRAVFQFRESERQIALFNDSLLPKAEQALAAAQQAYAEGQADFTVLMDARRTWLEFQLLAERAVADREIALGDIGCCIGAFDLMDLTSGTEGLSYENNEPS
jgi:cobalt-zinc-cadmium efflux system outer membrane protein